MLKISARNQLPGTVSKVEKGAVNAEVWVDLGDQNTLFSNITNAAIKELDIKSGDSVVAIIKSSSIILTTNEDIKISARNRLSGTIASIEQGAVNSEIKIELPSGQLITAIVTRESINELNLVKGSDCTALIKASQVILAKEN